MLRITIHDSARELRLCLEGKLAGPWVEELHGCWRTASSTAAGRETVLDLAEVDFVDTEGQTLLAEIHRQGVRLQAANPFIQAVLEEACLACGTVEGKAHQSRDALVRSDPAGPDSGPV